ncbi:WapI family immunity protein [Ekhidna sp.]|uniref:WapI family immunity protein n=1 Tax=Ekhidna sp. TaxID=2608089 RepID=UPI003BAB85A7
MNIHIGDNNEYLELGDIVTEGEGRGYTPTDSDFLLATIKLQLTGINTNIRATFMKGELNQFLTDLQKLYDTLKYEFVLSNLEDNIEVSFSPTPNGQIELKGCLRTQDYKSSVNFELTTDQTFIPKVINQLRSTLEQLENTV